MPWLRRPITSITNSDNVPSTLTGPVKLELRVKRGVSLRGWPFSKCPRERSNKPVVLTQEPTHQCGRCLSPGIFHPHLGGEPGSTAQQLLSFFSCLTSTPAPRNYRKPLSTSQASTLEVCNQILSPDRKFKHIFLLLKWRSALYCTQRPIFSRQSPPSTGPCFFMELKTLF